MTISLVQQPDTVYSGGGTSGSITFSVAPTQGNLIVFQVMCANNATITADDGTLTEVGTGYEAFRRLSTFAKIAGASEPTSYSFTISTSTANWVFATEYNTTDDWDIVTNAQHSITFDSSGSNSSVTTNIGATTAGSLLVAAGYMSDSTTGNQEITSGFSNFEQDDSTGTGRRAAQADKTGAGGSQSATYGTVNSANDNRLAVTLSEFLVTSSFSITDTTDPTVDQVQSTITTSGLTGTPSATLGGSSIVLSGSFPNLTYTMDVAGITTEQTGPLIGSLVQLAVTGNEGTPTANVTTQVRSGWAVTTLANPLNTGEGGIKKAIEDNSAKTVVAGDIIYYDTANNTSIATDGTITSDAATFDLKLGQGGDLTTPTTYTAFEVVFDESAIIEGLREFMSGIAVFDTLEEAQASNIAQNQVIFVTGGSSINDGNAAFYLCTVGGTIQTAGAYPLVKITLS